MRKIENDCVCCDVPCSNCGLKHAVHYYCDDCLDEDTLYFYDGQELCIECIKEKLEKVEEE